MKRRPSGRGPLPLFPIAYLRPILLELGVEIDRCTSLTVDADRWSVILVAVDHEGRPVYVDGLVKTITRHGPVVPP